MFKETVMRRFILGGLVLCNLVLGGIAEANIQPQLTPLPFLKKVESLEIRDNQPISVQFQFEPGWELNAKAPSWLALLEISDRQTPLVVQEFRGRQLTERTQFRALFSGKQYRLRGTFYFCQKTNRAGCRVESRDWKVTASATSKASNLIEIRLP
jgi:hypothetical protein